MPDVGVLNLQIHDNSSTAAEGLGRLAAKLEAVKAATGGVRLGNVATGIKRINDELKNVQPSAIHKLKQLADVLERISKISGNVGGIRISFGGHGQSTEEIATSMQAARAAISDANSDFEDFKATVQEVSTQDEELARSVNGVKQSVNQLDFSVFDPAKLPLDAIGMKLDDNAKELYQWKNAIKESFESVQQLKSKDLIKSFEEAEAAMKATKDAGEFGKDIVTSTSEATDALKELKEIAAQKWDMNFQQWFDSLEQTIQKLNEKLTTEQNRKRPSARTIAELSVAIDSYKKKLADLQDQQTRFTNGTYFAGEAIKKEFAGVPTEELGGKIEEVKNRIETMREALGKSDWNDAESIEKYNAMLDAMSAELEKAQAKWKAFTDQDNGNENKQVVFQSINDAARAMGISVDEAKRKLQQTYEMVYANQFGTTSFSSAEEASRALGISLEEVKRKCQESYDLLYGTGSTGTGGGDIFSHVKEGAETARTLLDMLRDKVQILRDEIDTGRTAKGALLSDKAIVNNEIQVEKLKQQIEQLQERLRAGQSLNGTDFVANLGDYSKIDLYKMKLDAMQQSLINDINANKLDTQAIVERSMRIMDLTDKIKAMETGQEEASESTEGLNGSFKRMFPTVSGLLSRFKNLVKYRMLRAVIKQISEGFREGTENYYYYSKAIGGEFAPSMDSAASALLQMKNSIGAAAAPLIQSLIPLLQTAVNAFVSLINYANQFLALLRGQASWSQALPATTSAFGDIENAANGAGAAVKDLLADWDELNIIQSETSGGGSGSGTAAMEDYLNMFEEVYEFDNKIKDIVGFIKDNFSTIMSIVEGIGAAILAWKISRAFGNELSMLSKLELMAGLVLLINGVKVSAAAGYDIGVNGLNSENLLSAIGGIVETALGTALVGVAFGGITGGLIGLTVGTIIGLSVLGWNMAEGSADALYGDVKLTAEEIEEEVNRLFSFDVKASLKNARVDHESIVSAKETVISEIHEMNADYITFKMKLTPESAATLLASVNRTIDATNALLAMYQKKISIGFGFTANFSDPEFVQQFSTDKLGDASQYITGLGNDIGKILEDGIVNEFEKDLFDDLMTKLSNVTKAISIGETSGKFVAETEKGFYGTDWTQASRETIKAYADQYYKQMENVREDAYLQALDSKASLKAAAMYMEQRNADEPGKYSAEEIKQAWDNYYGYDMQKAMDDYVNQATEEGRAIFTENMLDALNTAVERKNSKGGHLDTSKYGSYLSEGKALKEYINNNLATNLGWTAEEFDNLMKSADMTGWDLLPDAIRGFYITEIVKALGRNTETYSRLKDELGVTVGDLVTIQKGKWNEMGAEAQKQYIETLARVYGGREVLEALKSAGYSVSDLVDASTLFGVGSRESMYKTLAELYGPDALKEALAGIDQDETQEIWDSYIDGLLPDEQEAEVVTIPIELETQVTGFVGNTASGIQETLMNALNGMFAAPGDMALETEMPEVSLEGDALNYYNMIKNAYESGLGMEELKAASAQAFDMYGLDAFLEAYEELNKLAEQYKEITEQTPELAPGNAKPSSGNIFDRAAASVQRLYESVLNGTQGIPGFAMPSDITIHEERDNEQEASNTAEGVRRGNTDLVTGQNQANNYMAQMVRYLAIIAQKSGGSVGLAQSALGGMVSAAMEAFGNITG